MYPIIQEMDPKFTSRYKHHMRIGRYLHDRPRLRKLVLHVSQAFQSVAEDCRNHAQDIDFLERIRPSEDPSLHGITEQFGDVYSLIKYAQEIHSASFMESKTESRILYEHQKNIMTRILSRDPAPPIMLNFGVSYAHIDAALAREFVDTQFFGIDLSPYTKAINETEFAGVANLKFFNGDIFDLLEQHDFSGGVFFHSRTLVQLPRSFIERLYATCRERGFTYITGFEQFGFSRETQAPYVFDETDRDSVYWRNRFYIHNYPGLAVKAGFGIDDVSVFETARESSDFRLLSMVARRNV